MEAKRLLVGGRTTVVRRRDNVANIVGYIMVGGLLCRYVYRYTKGMDDVRYPILVSMEKGVEC